MFWIELCVLIVLSAVIGFVVWSRINEDYRRNEENSGFNFGKGKKTRGLQ